MIANTSTLNWCIALILMVAGHQRIGRRSLGHLCKKEIQEASTKDPLSTAREAAHRIVVMVKAEANTLFDLRIACFTAMR
jgi:hypothetical protein